jgi:putative hydrolase of the HAD superfamily
MFDLGNVVITDVEVSDCIQQRLGERAPAFVELYSRYVVDLMTGRMDSREFWDKLPGPRVDEDLLGACFHPKVDERMKTLLKVLKSSGNRVVCATNTHDSHFSILKSWEVFSLFDEIYASHLMGLAKPDYRFFEHIIGAEQARAEHIFFTDDLRENVEAAAACGIDAYWFTGIESILDALSM